MRILMPAWNHPVMGIRRSELGGARLAALVAAGFLLGLGGGAYLYHRLGTHTPANGGPAPTTPTPTPTPAPAAARGLAEGTKTVLQHLEAPVAIRFYAVLDPATVPTTIREFAGRVNQLLTLYQQAGNGRVQVTSHTARSDAAESAAAEDGIRAFNLDKGDACYLGIALAQGDRKELVQLAPEWEAALESDLSRAITRVNAPKPAPGPAVVAAPVTDRVVIEEVKRAIPNVATVSVAEGTRILREKALVDFAAATQEMETQVKQAEQRFTEAKDEPARQTARVELQRVRTEQTEKLKAIAIRMQERINALEQMKKP